jgi:hypothetical protein
VKSLVIGIVFGLSAGFASAEGEADTHTAACAAMQATFAPKEAELAVLKDKRDAAAKRPAARGAATEITTVSDGIVDFESAERDLVRREHGHQAAARQLHSDRLQYAAACAAG